MKGQVFRAALADAGVQYLDWKAGETGDVNKIGWTQTNTIDALGHDHGHALADMLDQQLDLVAERIQGAPCCGLASRRRRDRPRFPHAGGARTEGGPAARGHRG